MKLRWTIVLLTMAVAVCFRFGHIKTVPPGLFPDEAMNGNNALQAIATSDYKVFYPENHGREGLFINVQAMSIMLFGNEPWALRIVSAAFGVLTVLGTYFLATQLFNWQIGAMSSFMLAISFWHTLFSRVGFRAISAPFFLVWALFFFWRGLHGGRLYSFAVSGIFWGLGFYTYISFRAIPLVLILALLAYLQSQHKKLDDAQYIPAGKRILKGLTLLGIITLIVLLPLGLYFWKHPGDFLGRTAQLSVFTTSDPIKNIVANTGKTLGMFNVSGDINWRHNYSGSPELFWPIGILFLAGFARSVFKLIRTWIEEHRFSTVRVLLLSWFFISLVPCIISNEGLPHALRAILVTPAVFIFAGEGLWWLCDRIINYRAVKGPDGASIHRKATGKRSFAVFLAAAILLTASACCEYDKYFNKWAKNPNVPPYFEVNFARFGRLVNAMEPGQKKYIVVRPDGEIVNGIPMWAQTVMFITDTWTAEKQKKNSIYYLTEDQYRRGTYDKKATVLFMQ